MKKIVLFIMLMTLLSVMLSAPALAAEPSVTASNVETDPGETITITVSMANNPGIYDMDMSASYDSSLLELTDITAGALLPNAEVYAATGKVSYYTSSVGDYSDGVLATFTFKVKDDASGSTSVSFDILMDDAEENELTIAASATVTINTPAHVHSMTAVPAKEATCEEAGYKAYWTCSGCNKMFSDAEGTNEISAPEVVEALGHDWDEGTVTTEATCETAGVKTYTCRNDSSHTKTEEIPALGHTLTAVAAKAATCTEAGYEAYWKCETCGKLFSDAEGTTEIGAPVEIPVTAHTPTAVSAKDATCEDDGNIEYWTCSVCGKYFSDEACTTEITEADTVIAALGHTPGDTATVTKEPTCTETGTQSYICTVCGKEISGEEIPALGHDWDEGTVTTEPTCEETGVKTYTCSRCGDTKTEEIEALGHDWDEGTVTTEPTCEETGVKTYTCKNDSTHTKTEEIEALGHDWDEGTVTKNATATEQGEITYTCNRDSSHTKIEKFDPIVSASVTSGTDEASQTALKAAVAALSGYSENDAAYYDVSLQVSYDNGATYETVTAADTMPASGVTVTIPYPSGTNGSNNDFVVLQKLADGTVVTLAATETSSGLTVTVKQFGTSFAVAFKKVQESSSAATPFATSVPTAAPESAPRTGDDSNIALWAAAFLTFSAGLVVVLKKKVKE